MLFFDALGALISLDLGFFIDITLDNLFWVLAFYAVIHILVEGKNALFYFLLFAPYLWIFIDFNEFTGLAWHGAIGLALWFVLRLFATAFSERVPFLQRNFMAIWVVVAFGNILFNTFIRDW